ncbi:MAG: Cyclic pyranopterin monophosphate synthase accessory protein [Alphaproteobacteria bacterium MarineAlpha5_Bin12]|nr:MAG: Cyclic pyranopterin monophosphate synthase accessory protein [Alphaproteobacteria bacterium MarineAlpha5_Bin12]|tara:strand:+ start:52009 stop:52497 length:489 start_codon:yes stop_codon:yes gene_type:complete
MKKNIIKHLTKGRSPNIVDISKKKETKRIAIAEGFIRFNKKTYNKISKIKISKGEIINVSIISGIMASKKTHELIPLCHNIPIENVNIDIKSIDKNQLFKVICKVSTFAKTGVEMEALTGVSITLLTIYDMCKSINKDMTIENISLIQKTGGKSGKYIKKLI